MSDAGKIGVVAVLLWLGATVLVVRAAPPMGFALSVISFALGCIAAWRGNKWWLTLPFAMLVELCLGLLVGLNAV
jgi:hypothetical protein